MITDTEFQAEMAKVFPVCEIDGCVFSPGHTIKHSFEYTGGKS